MARWKMTALLGVVSVAATLGMATPAYAASESKMCGALSGVTGYTEKAGQGTYVDAWSWGTCGKLGLRVNYSHVGGDSWTSWKYSTGGHWNVTMNVKNSLKSAHSATATNLFFYSYR